jgi:cobyrinic acid a,c-diamide synthase
MPFQFDDLLPIVPFRQCRIAIADDSCFGPCFQDNADLLRLLGAEMVPFSPLADVALPPGIGGLYLPGAYLGEYGETLSANKSIYQSIRDFAGAGGVIYSEGAGTAFLCQSFLLTQDGRKHDGVGLIARDAVRVLEEPRAIMGTMLEDSVLAPAGRSVHGYSTGEWSIKRGDSSSDGVFEVMRFQGPSQEPLQSMLSATAQSCSTLHFLHFGSNPDFARGLVLAAAAHQKTVAGAIPRA